MLKKAALIGGPCRRLSISLLPCSTC